MEVFLRYSLPRPPSVEPYTLQREAQVYRAIDAAGLRAPRLLAQHPTRPAIVTERARGIAETAIETLALSLDLLEPDGTILLDLEPELGLARARDRNQLQGSSLEEGRFEAEELSFHKAVREAYLRLAGRWPERIRIVQACGTPDEVFSRITPHLEEWITTVLGKGL